MAGHEHPKGPWAGRVYATPEEALIADESPLVIPIEKLRENLESPPVTAMVESVRAVDPDEAMTLEEYGERFGESEAQPELNKPKRYN